jgi:hypothetical protein
MAGYNVSALVDYEQNFPILRASILGAKSASIFYIANWNQNHFCFKPNGC